MIKSKDLRYRATALSSPGSTEHAPRRAHAALPWLLLLIALPAHAHMEEDTLNAVANVLAWVVLLIAPVVGIGCFLMIHVLPEKLAEKRRHPQLAAIKTLCFLSLVFGGLLWPLAWLWAFSKPVLYKRAYGADVIEEEESSAHAEQPPLTREG